MLNMETTPQIQMRCTQYEYDFWRYLHTLGLSDVAIGAIAGRHTYTISRWRKKHRIPPTTKGGRSRHDAMVIDHIQMIIDYATSIAGSTNVYDVCEAIESIVPAQADKITVSEVQCCLRKGA